MNAGLKKLIVYGSVFIAGVTLGSIGTLVFNQPASTDLLLLNMASKYLSKERGKSTLSATNRYNTSDTMLASRDHKISQQKKKIDKLLDRVTYQEETIELLQEILNENTLPPDTSLGNFVYQELEGLGLADEEILKLMQNFINLNYEDIPTYMSIKDFGSLKSSSRHKVLGYGVHIPGNVFPSDL